MHVLVTGGAGYIGSHAVRELLDRGYSVTVLDDLSNGHAPAVDSRARLVCGRTGDRVLVETIFSESMDSEPIEAVLHFAANIEVGESVLDPLKYYQNNLASTLSLLEIMEKYRVRKFVFSSTAAVYGIPDTVPISETQRAHPINPYGRSKWMVELVLADCRQAYGLGYTILRYFNVAGAHPSGELGEDHCPESHLIPRILQSVQSGQSVKVYGTNYSTADGTCIRDYVHVVDLVRAHILGLESLHPNEGRIYNLGSEQGFSVREVIARCEEVVGKPLLVEEEARRAGDPAILVANSEKIRKELGWQPRYPDLLTTVTHAWNWHSLHPQGYRKNEV